MTQPRTLEGRIARLASLLDDDRKKADTPYYLCLKELLDFAADNEAQTGSYSGGNPWVPFNKAVSQALVLQGKSPKSADLMAFSIVGTVRTRLKRPIEQALNDALYASYNSPSDDGKKPYREIWDLAVSRSVEASRARYENLKSELGLTDADGGQNVSGLSVESRPSPC